MSKVAVVFGYSEDGIDLAKRLLITLRQHCIQDCRHVVDVYPYVCNFEIANRRDFALGMGHQEIEVSENAYRYLPPRSPFFRDAFKEIGWQDDICVMDCSIPAVQKFYLPDVCIYHDFATNHALAYDYVLYCHNDLIFKSGSIDRWIEIVDDDKYSIITEVRGICNQDISMRFHCCFIFVNVAKFEETKLSFINNLALIDGDKFHAYSNGGSGLMASFYAKDTPKKYQPFLLDTHGVYRDRNIDKSEARWFRHFGGIEWNKFGRSSEGGCPERTLKAYLEARQFVKNWRTHLGRD